MHLLFLSLASLSGFFLTLFSTLSYLYLSTSILIIGLFLQIPGLFFSILMIDSISRESPDLIKISLSFIFTTAFVIFSFNPDFVYVYLYPNGEFGVFQRGNLLIATMLIAFMKLFIYLYFSFSIYLNSPKIIRNYALVPIIAVFIFLLSSIFIILRITLIIPAVHILINGIGQIVFAIGFIIQPKLAYILPFKKIHHIYFYTSDGASIYDQTFKSEEKISPNLVSGVLTGISALIQEVTQTETFIKSLNQENRIILLEHGKYISVALVTEKNHIVLHQNLTKLVKIVESSFKEEFENFKGEITPFSKIRNLVNEIFIN